MLKSVCAGYIFCAVEGRQAFLPAADALMREGWIWVESIHKYKKTLTIETDGRINDVTAAQICHLISGNKDAKRVIIKRGKSTCFM